MINYYESKPIGSDGSEIQISLGPFEILIGKYYDNQYYQIGYQSHLGDINIDYNRNFTSIEKTKEYTFKQIVKSCNEILDFLGEWKV